MWLSNIVNLVQPIDFFVVNYFFSFIGKRVERVISANDSLRVTITVQWPLQNVRFEL